MGMNEEQINDLCLLNTGECIVNQDGDRKSYMCKVFRTEPKDVDDEISEVNNAENETVSATQKYKSLHSSMFVSDLTDIDLEDMRFRDDLYKAMLAIGVGQSPEKCLAKILKRTSKQVCIYWIQICQEIWGFYGGETRRKNQ